MNTKLITQKRSRHEVSNLTTILFFLWMLWYSHLTQSCVNRARRVLTCARLTKSGDAVTRKHPLDTQVVMGKFSSHVRFPEGRFNHWKEKAGMWWVNHWWNDSLQLVAGIYHVQAIFKTNHRAANQLMSSGIINVLVDSGNHTWAAFKNALNKFIKELTFF